MSDLLKAVEVFAKEEYLLPKETMDDNVRKLRGIGEGVWVTLTLDGNTLIATTEKRRLFRSPITVELFRARNAKDVLYELNKLYDEMERHASFGELMAYGSARANLREEEERKRKVEARQRKEDERFERLRMIIREELERHGRH